MKQTSLSLSVSFILIHLVLSLISLVRVEEWISVISMECDDEGNINNSGGAELESQQTNSASDTVALSIEP